MENSRTPKTSLTEARYGVLAHLNTFVMEHGYCPSIRELASRLGAKSHSSIHFHLDLLVREGYLTRKPGRARSYELTPKARGMFRLSGKTWRLAG